MSGLTPKPKPSHIVCDVCGLDWSLHKGHSTGKVPITECVRLLKAELAKRPKWQQTQFSSTPAFYNISSSQ